MKKYIIDMLLNKQVLIITLSDGSNIKPIEVINEYPDEDNLIELKEANQKVSFLLNISQVITARPFIPVEWKI